MASHTTPFFLFLLLLVLTTAPLETYARNTQFFSKVSRSTTTPQASDPKPATKSIPPSASAPIFTKAADERGYGLYEYPPTTTNPTKSKPADLGKLAESDDEGHESFFQREEGSETGGKQGSLYGATGEKQGMSFFQGEGSETGEKQGMAYGTAAQKQGMAHGTAGEKQGRVYGNRAQKQGISDTRFLENGKLFQGERSETGEKQGRVYGSRVQKQGMSDTRFLENGKYFYDIEAEKTSNNNNNNNNGYSNSYKYRNEEEEEEEEDGGDEFGSELYGTGEEQGRQGNNRVYGKQGMSDTRYLENGKYFYDIEAEKKSSNDGYSNNVAFYDTNNKYQGEGNNGEELFYDTGKSSEYSVKGGNLKGLSPNKFPRYEFDSMEEYEKYEAGRSHQNEYSP